MIIVTGTKRSGTSMWMQVLRAAGVHVLGEAFPKNWEQTIREANPHGFYESPLRGGIYYATNPDPRTGTYLRPQDVTSAAVKVFIPGLCRTDLAYVGRVVGTMRHWREYSSSLARLRAMEDDARREKLGDEAPVFPRLDPVLEWWLENFALVRDIVTRQYPAHLVSYERVLARPTETLMPLLEWVGAPDPQAGAEVVSPQTRTQDRASEEEASVEDFGHGAVFDEFYRIIHDGEPMTNAFLRTLNQTHESLVGLLEEDRRRVFEASRARLAKQRPPVDALSPDILDALIHGPGAVRESD